MSAGDTLRLPARPQKISLGAVPPARIGAAVGLILLVLIALLPALVNPTKASQLTTVNSKTVKRVFDMPRAWPEAGKRLSGFYRGELARSSEGGKKVTQLVGGLLGALALGLAWLGQAARGVAVAAPMSDRPLRLAEAGPLRARASLQPANEGGKA